MTYTTTKAIRRSLESLIKGLDPTGLPMGRPTYKLAASGFEWGERIAKSDVDRKFTVEDIGPGEANTFGLTTEIDYTGRLRIMIGHKKQTNKQDGLERRNTDVIQIQQAVEKKQNFPSGVSNIRWESLTELDDDPEYWVSEIDFRMTFTLQAP